MINSEEKPPIGLVSGIRSIYNSELKKEITNITSTLLRLQYFFMMPILLLMVGNLLVVAYFINIGHSLWAMLPLFFFGGSTAIVCGVALGTNFALTRIIEASRNLLDLCFRSTIDTLNIIGDASDTTETKDVKGVSVRVYDEVSELLVSEVNTNLKSGMGLFSYPVSKLLSRSMQRSKKAFENSAVDASFSEEEALSVQTKKAIEGIENSRGKVYNALNSAKVFIIGPFRTVFFVYGIFSLLVYLLVIWISG